MSQTELNRLVANATGESVGTIVGMGFSVADPDLASFDPEPYDSITDIEKRIVDWDKLDAERSVPPVLQPAA